jgi:hypothetical protein
LDGKLIIVYQNDYTVYNVIKLIYTRKEKGNITKKMYAEKQEEKRMQQIRKVGDGLRSEIAKWIVRPQDAPAAVALMGRLGDAKFFEQLLSKIWDEAKNSGLDAFQKANKSQVCSGVGLPISELLEVTHANMKGEWW